MSLSATKRQALTARIEARLNRVQNIGQGTPRHAQLLALIARIEARLRVQNIGQGTPRHAQLLALILLPFVFVCAMTASVAIKEVVDSFVPNTGAIAPILFLVGMTLFVASLFFCFIWVKTGGLGIFA